MFFEDFKRSYKKRIRERIHSAQDALGHGKVGSFDEYKRQVGFIAGLETALAEFNEAVKQRVDDGDDDEFVG